MLTDFDTKTSPSVPAEPLRRRDGALLDRAFTRAAGAPLVTGNDVRLLKDAAENYPAWLAAIHGAEHTVYFENYIFREDGTGAEFAEALGARARGGVRVRVIYDWMGGLGKTSGRFWRSLREAGVEVRCFNPLQFSSPFAWVHRDHRKTITVDGRVGFISGLCVDHIWGGDPKRGIEPWRDTGIEVRGPVLCDMERAFAQVWAATGAPLPADELTPRESIALAGDVAMRIVANAPGNTGLFRLDQLIAAAARRTLWLTDAYFAGIPPYVQALRAAAGDGVDVRLLVPGASDIPILRPLSQSGYRPLLEAGIRVFEWQGTMLHAKTAVSDCCWARVGSSNLNIASWVGNYEMDAVIEDERFAAALEQLYLADLDHSVEIVLRPRRRRFALDTKTSQATGSGARRESAGVSGSSGSASRAAAGALRLGRTVGAALTEQRVLEPAEARLLFLVGALLLGLGAVALYWPLVIAAPFSVMLAWISIALLARAHALRRQRRAGGQPAKSLVRTTAASPDTEPHLPRD
ncbi:MAG TPA: phospholipase D-like domain-containing protein [Steroidobacteraceae bacterium]|jgi:cardiolipin synthase|nr:phospholipase D-like domain-containing protein [Steroidobacteraceae bacterium]